ncbi:MAG: hypothetical protein FWF38_00510 [Spirochaetaceae bacterium]|nr:hypothetical protein [Spirochaetaceae bacterium]
MDAGLSPISTWVDVCNNALAKTHNNLIAALDEGSENQKYCSLFLPQAVIDVLDVFNFQSTVTDIELARDAERPVFGYEYMYPLPSDLLRIIKIFFDNDINTPAIEDYAVEGNYVKTNAEKVYLKYIAMPENPTQLLPYQIRAIISSLALKLCTPLVSDNELYQKCLIDYQKDVEQAKINDAHNTAHRKARVLWYDEER